jgi:hypothetical protein
MTKSEYRHKDGKGSLFKNQYKKLDTHADLNGKAVIEGKEYYVNAWKSETTSGDFKLNLTINPVKTKEEMHQYTGAGSPEPLSAGKDHDDIIPF